MGYRDELEALRAQRDAAEAELAELRVETKRLQEKAEELEQQEREVRILRQQVMRLESRLDPQATRRRRLGFLVVVLGGGALAALLTMPVEATYEVPLARHAPDDVIPVEVDRGASVAVTTHYAGEPVEMKQPKARRHAAFCKHRDIPHNAVQVQSGRLEQVLVGIENGQLPKATVPSEPVRVGIRDCVLTPRVQGAQLGQSARLENHDPVLHNFNVRHEDHAILNVGAPADSPAQELMLDELGVYRIQCDVHPWERSFVVVLDNSAHAVAESGFTVLSGLPPMELEIFAWHPRFGKKSASVRPDQPRLELTFDGTEPAPPANRGELDDMF
jgi:hypothetical protein